MISAAAGKLWKRARVRPIPITRSLVVGDAIGDACLLKWHAPRIRMKMPR